MAVKVRPLTVEERSVIEKRAGSRIEPARVVERARMVLLSSRGLRVNEIAGRVGCAACTVRQWLKRFNADGLDGLNEQPHPGRKPQYTVEQVGLVIAAALTKPETLGLPFACWTLDRLMAYLHEEKGLKIKRTRIHELLVAEGLRWRQQETWFSERVDPQFVEKRGQSRSYTLSHRRKA